ncbi:hypothetical protein BSL78_05710 [Apostichopus japonicus]|uniref:Uncharacterized protein n=1 Tax=Stichopus japonicus TaxID=307972 RepID=A0A2G8LAT5_STIJA|nr:hypothetical protein BSL78_05710 [Apostichopus japonicus]
MTLLGIRSVFRALLDRAYTPFNDDFREFEGNFMNFSREEESPLPHRTEEEDRKTLFRPVHKQLSLPLTHILEEIKAKRMPHFRPKTPPPDQESSRLPLLPPADPIYLDDPYFVTMEGDANQEMLSESLLNAAQGLQPIVQRIDNSQDLQDSQMIEVDVVGHDTPQTPVSFIQTLRPTAAVNSMEGIKSSDGTQNLDIRTDNLNLGRNGTVIGNHIGGHPAEDNLTAKVPEGHSTAPADTVLELNYPLPSTKTVVVTENIVQDGLKADSKSEVSVQIKQESVTTMNEKISVTKASPITINTALSIQSVDVKTTKTRCEGGICEEINPE